MEDYRCLNGRVGEPTFRSSVIAACAAAATVLSVAGCAYTYEGKGTPRPSASTIASAEPPSPVVPPLLDGSDAQSWGTSALSRAPGVAGASAVLQGVGTLTPLSDRHQTQIRLDPPRGTYQLTIVCRVAGTVDVAVSADGKTEFSTSWTCGLPHETSLNLSPDRDYELRVSLNSQLPANFAYRLDREFRGQS